MALPKQRSFSGSPPAESRPSVTFLEKASLVERSRAGDDSFKNSENFIL